MMLKSSVAFALIAMFVFAGCADPEPVAEKEKPRNMFNERTQDIGEAKPGQEQADLQVKPSQGLVAPLAAAPFMLSQISKMAVKQHLELYKAVEGHYPKTHNDFMADVIKKNNIQLPVLPGKRRYQYDVENHELIVVEAEKEETAD